MNNYKFLTSAALSMLTVACGSTPPPALPTYPDVNISSLAGVSDEIDAIASGKILVVPGIKSDVSSQVQDTFGDNIREFVIESGSEVIDRNLAKRFKKEIQLKENLAENYEAYEGPVEAKFLVIPTVTSVSYGSEYEKSYTSKTKKGDTIRHDPECDYSGKAKGNIQIRALPSMKQLLTLNLSGSASSSQENPASRKCNEVGLINGVVNNAIANMLEKGDENYVVLSKYVGSQGIITAAKSVNGKLYFETNLGRINGAKAKEPVAIYQQLEGELVKIATGVMVDTDNIYNKKSFITVDGDASARIKRGMIVMLSGECASFMCSLKTSVNGAVKSLSSNK